MKICARWLLMLLAIVVIFAGFQLTPQIATGQPPARQSKWEYKVYERGNNDSKDAYAQDLNELGAEGWEAVAATEGTHKLRCVLKRAK